MSILLHPLTTLPIGDPELQPLERRALPRSRELRERATELILSPSGWRKIFASPLAGEERAGWSAAIPEGSGEGLSDEDSLSERVSQTDLVLAGAMALVFGDYLVERSGRRDAALLLGIDSRPTGPALADLMTRVWLARGLRPRHLFIIAAPELLAYSRRATSLETDHEERAEGFCYISASHNPPGYNGVKFGTGGGVLAPAEAKELIARYRRLLEDEDLATRIFALVDEAEPRAVSEVFTSSFRWKRRAVSAYTLFAREIVTGRGDLVGQEALFDEMEAAAKTKPLGIVAELNGSARSLSIDFDFLGGLGLRVLALNDRPRAFVHRIVPEGESLEPARAALEEAHRGDRAFVAGYVPDCDGDRGNLVYWDEGVGRARLLGAQEVFALSVLSELCLLEREGTRGRRAVVVNDATSLRIETIASFFGVETHRAETGEANVVGLAASLREAGVLVRILGEGSNGGNITAPAEVRDPLATLGALLKLLLLRGSEKSEALFHIWLRLSGQLGRWKSDFGLDDILASLPAYATTSVFETRAALRIRESDQIALKTRYRELFLRAWEMKKTELAARFGVTGYRALASLGSEEKDIGEDFAASGRGGLKILLVDGEGKARGFLWMRGSGTEAVLRIMADIQGGSALDEEWLLAWQTELVRAADGAN